MKAIWAGGGGKYFAPNVMLGEASFQASHSIHIFCAEGNKCCVRPRTKL